MYFYVNFIGESLREPPLVPTVAALSVLCMYIYMLFRKCLSDPFQRYLEVLRFGGGAWDRGKV